MVKVDSGRALKLVLTYGAGKHKAHAIAGAVFTLKYFNFLVLDVSSRFVRRKTELK